MIPRAFSSGALSIWSYVRTAIFRFFFASTIVIAAVSVVFPWSTCPIVPTFTCGFVRSNFCLAMDLSSVVQDDVNAAGSRPGRLASRLRDDLVRHRLAAACS